MKKLTTSVGEQTIRIIPRVYPDEITLTLRDDSTNTSVSYTIESLQWEYINDDWNLADYTWETTKGMYVEDGYLYITNNYALIEGRFYDLTIVSSGEVIYKDKVFCTDQTVDQDTNNYYSVNDGVYTTENTYDNDYIII
jgi:hypothetical protein